MTQLGAALVLHLLPILPAWFGHWYGAAACAVFVVLAYAKTCKLEIKLEELRAAGVFAAQLEKQSQLAARWRFLTFLDWWRQRRSAR